MEAKAAVGGRGPGGAYETDGEGGVACGQRPRPAGPATPPSTLFSAPSGSPTPRVAVADMPRRAG